MAAPAIVIIVPALIDESFSVGVDVLALDCVCTGECVLVGVGLLDLDRDLVGLGECEMERLGVRERVGMGVLVGAPVATRHVG
jgi:hypothetical protein